MARNVLALCALLVAGCRGGHGSALPPPSPGAPDGDAPGPAPDAAMPGAKEAGAPDLSTSEVPQPAAPDASADAAALAADTVWKACGSLAADITALAQSPDGKLLAIGYADGRVTLIEQAGMTVVGRFEINARLGIDKMTFTEDGGTLLTAGGGSVKVWTVPAGTFVRELGLTIGASSLQVTGGPMPLVLAAGGNVPPVTVWRLDGTRLGAMGDGPQAAFTDGGQAVVVIDNGSSPSRVTTLALDGTMLRRFPLPPFGGPRALSPDGTAVAVLFGDGTTEWVELYSTVNGKRLWRSTDGVKRTRQLAFLANPPRVVQLGDLGTRPLIHDATTGKTLAPLPFERAAEIDPAADGASVVAITGAGQLAKVSVADGAVRPGPASEFGVTQRIFGIAVSRDGRLLAAAGLSATWILDVREGALVKAMEVPGWKPDFSPDGSALAMGGYRRAIYRVRGAEPPVTIDTGDAGPCLPSLVFSPDGKTLASGTCGKVELFRPDGTRLGEHPSMAVTVGVAFSPDGKRLGTTGPELWPADGTTPLWPTNIPPPPDNGEPKPTDNTVAFSPDGALMLVSRSQGLASLLEWGVSTDVVRTSDGMVMAALGMRLGRRPSLSADGSWVVGGGNAVYLPTGQVRVVTSDRAASAFLGDNRLIAWGTDHALRFFCPTRP